MYSVCRRKVPDWGRAGRTIARVSHRFNLLDQSVFEKESDAVAATGEDVTDLLRAVQNGDKQAEGRLIQLIYPELRRLARRQMRRERPNHTLQTTALVHEAYLRLTLQGKRSGECRTQFLAIAANLMRQVLIDHARARVTQKRGGGQTISL